MTASELLQTHLSPTPAETSQLPLTDAQILNRFGPLLWDAYQAFGSDPGYATEMVQAANQSELHRQNRALARVGEAAR